MIHICFIVDIAYISDTLLNLCLSW